MGFLRINDLSEVKIGELNLDFQGGDKNSGLVVCKLKRNKIKCKIEPLEVSGHWFRVLRQLTCPQVFFVALGSMTYSHFPNQIFIYL